jgi:hypothetical protein
MTLWLEIISVVPELSGAGCLVSLAVATALVGPGLH